MKKIILLLFVLLAAFSGNVFCQEQTDSVSQVNDSTQQTSLPTDLTASIVIAEPGEDFYSSYGHCVVRLRCPSKDLDFCYTYSLDENWENEISMFTGKGKAAYYAIKTDTFTQNYIDEGRGVYSYDINLKTEQVRDLWQYIDKSVSDGAIGKYNYLHTNCSSMTLYAIEACLGKETIDWGNLDPGITGTYRNFVKTISEMRPWTGLFWTTILGAGGDEVGDMEDKMGPTLLVPAMKGAKLITEDGQQRPFLNGEVKEINKGTIVYDRGWFTPVVAFILLLVIVIAVSAMELTGKAQKVVLATDIVLLALQTFWGIIIFYLSVISDMTGAAGNINLLILNPLPLILWAIFGRKKWYGKVWYLYSIAIIIYMLLFTVSPQVDGIHLLIASPLLVRCMTKAYHNRLNTKTLK